MRDVAERLLNVATLGADIVERLISLDYYFEIPRNRPKRHEAQINCADRAVRRRWSGLKN